MRLTDLLREMDDDGYDASMYERERKVSVLILRAFRRCGLDVLEHDSKHSGTRDHGDSWGHRVLYTEDDHEATVELDGAELEDLVKLSSSGLLEGPCEVTASSSGALRLTFKVHPHLRDGTAEMS